MSNICIPINHVLFPSWILTDERQKSLDGAAVEGVKFHTAVTDMLHWLNEAEDSVDSKGPVSGQKDLLVKQLRDHEV